MSEPVEVHTILKHEELPENIRIFRKIISKFKNHILKSLESPSVANKTSSHDPKKLDKIVEEIRRFGNIIEQILSSHVNADIHKKIIEYFDDRNTNDRINLLNLTREEKDLCKHYIFIDIKTYPLDLNMHSYE